MKYSITLGKEFAGTLNLMDSTHPALTPLVKALHDSGAAVENGISEIIRGLDTKGDFRDTPDIFKPSQNASTLGAFKLQVLQESLLRGGGMAQQFTIAVDEDYDGRLYQQLEALKAPNGPLLTLDIREII